MENLTKQEIDYSMAKERVNQLRKFYVSLAIFAVLLAIYSFRNYYLNGEITFFSFNNFSGIFWIWGLILAIRAVKIFFFHHSWERKMMDKELNK
ncbi:MULTISPECIES: 2TM domain-containing protein [unclassified Kaistella]|uniref:2TM domain-containing protein n=1 Tax=unclassified Kaistella TaxID=2762626 RepID=UPI002734D874|nr:MULTISPECIES: 2TM domain-containing protein [unclassified Kaistella]MDP2452982.1 2TM domain-containing protein [Kaistella sp. SH11-4b]MDP2455891.1 2TM domain-containing protein [Kaistella sp. SH40-3]MDP2458795.1 2TM domain-containing protein [Kaistella sp. SH19-2b]